MNERIKQLAEQATDKWMGGEFFDRKKFAELIVKECAKLVEGQPHFDKMLDCATVIEQHFGVEE